MYTILIKYQTGDSFNSTDTEDTIGYSFETREEARVVLGYIKEHYDLYKTKDSYMPRHVIENKINSCRKKPWFNNKEDYNWEYSIIYKDTIISCFWCGYFDILYSAHVILETEEDTDKDSFYV